MSSFNFISTGKGHPSSNKVIKFEHSRTYNLDASNMIPYHSMMCSPPSRLETFCPTINKIIQSPVLKPLEVIFTHGNMWSLSNDCPFTFYFKAMPRGILFVSESILSLIRFIINPSPHLKERTWDTATQALKKISLNLSSFSLTFSISFLIKFYIIKISSTINSKFGLWIYPTLMLIPVLNFLNQNEVIGDFRVSLYPASDVFRDIFAKSFKEEALLKLL